MSEAAHESSLPRVAKVVDEYTVVITRGAEHGVKLGSRFLIYGIGEEIYDPETAQSLGNLELVRGIGSAIHVQEKLSIVRSAKTRSPTPTVRTIKRTPRISAAFIGQFGDETVEERQGEPTIVPFEGVMPGDFARPL